MTRQAETIPIKSRDYWFKVVEMLQQNWALIDHENEGVVVWFIGDTSGVFDEIRFAAMAEAEAGLRRNGFRRFADDLEASSFVVPPEAPFRRQPHPNGPIYSSGRFWKLR